MLLGKTIKKIRETRELTQEFMAYEMGISQSSYAKIESNQVRLDLIKVSLISKIFNLSIVDQITYYEERTKIQSLTRKTENISVAADLESPENQIKIFHSLINQLNERVNELQKEIQILKNG